MPDLDEQLTTTRTRLLDEIVQPDLASISGRAATLRARRRAGRAGSVLVALATVAALAWQPWTGGGTSPDPAATPAPTPTSIPAMVFTQSGVTVNGLLGTVTELPGEVRDAEFIDPDRGWVLAADCGTGTCQLTVAGTEDGGLTWTVHPVSAAYAGQLLPDLITFGPDALGLAWPEGTGQVSTDGGATWQVLPPAAGGSALPKLDGQDRLVVRQTTAWCTGSVVERWRPTGRSLVTAPPIDVCWVAPVRAAGGGWWVGGSTEAGRAAAAVTYDGGTNWQPREFDGLQGSVRLATLGSDVYAAVVDRAGALLAIYHSADRGASFTRTWHGGTAPYKLGGDLVPLLDNRLLVVDDNDEWFVSDNRGVYLDLLDKLPAVGVVTRTPAGYIAYDMVARGFTAYSTDGATWRKLHVH